MSDLRITIDLLGADQQVAYPSDENLRIFLSLALVRAGLSISTSNIRIEDPTVKATIRTLPDNEELAHLISCPCGKELRVAWAQYSQALVVAEGIEARIKRTAQCQHGVSFAASLPSPE